ncbi:gas vesicle protein GvpH [Natronosalvus vescus]|uniref:gas vesicle protein GvpH n=1 Tax=Natronosalvus vescus TaxID=2953881 RepID=UPI00209087A0|nr:gas vesicle protein GvpH [Natronosalvus vescus]
MVDPPHDPGESNGAEEPPDDERTDRPGGIISQLFRLFEAIDDASTGRGRPQRRRGIPGDHQNPYTENRYEADSDRSSFDVDLDVRMNPLESAVGDHESENDRGFERHPRRRRIRENEPAVDVTVNRYDDELEIVADLSTVDPGDVRVGVENGSLVVAVGTTELERVEIPWSETTETAAINNDVLTVVVRRADDDRGDRVDTDSTTRARDDNTTSSEAESESRPGAADTGGESDE